MKNSTTIARKLRQQITPQENILWFNLRGNRFSGFKFRRQYPIDSFVVDFCCYSKKLVIEIDGGQHAEDNNVIQDQLRDKKLESLGYKVLRFWNSEINTNLEGVLKKILEELKLPSSLPFSPGRREN